MVSNVALLGTFSPRKCGIATFTGDLSVALGNIQPALKVDPFAMSDREYEYPPAVRGVITADDPISYISAAKFLNQQKYDVLSVQHEFGIFGGDVGNFLLTLVRRVEMPVVTTLHTVLRHPTSLQRRLMDELLQLSSRIIVMSQTAVDLLSSVHSVDRSKVTFIPHGIPRIPSSAGVGVRSEFVDEGPLLLTFGLLSPDKGLQSVIQAMPKLITEFPNAKYLIVGATHPNVIASHGEAYRESLIKLAHELGVENHVVFVNEFVSLESLIGYLSATDFYITPYLNPMQITSGTLAYSLGAGKVVISTPYEYAKEVLAENRGILVPFESPDSIAEAVISSWTNRESSDQLSANASAYGAQMYWDRVGQQYAECFELALATNKTVRHLACIHKEQTLPSIHIEHLLNLTDDTGAYQHATFCVPNRQEGYCTDDNARALILTAQLDSSTLGLTTKPLQARYLSFLVDALNPQTGRFRNFMSFRREWLEDFGSEDSQGRAVWALGTLVELGSEHGHVQLAYKVFERAAPVLVHTTSPRTWAYVILGAAAILRRHPDCEISQELIDLLGHRLNDLYSQNATHSWPWIEPRLAYANARIPQALMLAGEALGEGPLVENGIESLQWLMDQQVAPSGCFSPVGSAGRGQSDSNAVQFDQQPIEAWSSVSACLAASRYGDAEEFKDRAALSFQWFLGDNVHGLALADLDTGGCADGLHSTGLNLNQGAESTLAYLCSLAEIKNANGDLRVTLENKKEYSSNTLITPTLSFDQTTIRS